MILAMLLAHLVGDYVLQWDSLARWKGRELKGVVAHGSIILAVTWLFALPFDPNWWPWVVFIGLTHTAIDAVPLWLSQRFSTNTGSFALIRYLVDQAVHIGIILIALLASGYLTLPSLMADLTAALHSHRWLAYALGYAFIAMPAWILVEFTTYGLVNGSAPDFSHAIKNKYVGTLERGLIATFVILGQFMLVPLVALPRLIFDSPQIMGSQHTTLYIAEWLASLALAVLIGLGLSRM